MSDPYTPLFKDILMSTIWMEPSDTRIVFITMLAMANADGFVPGSIPGIANVARVSVEAVRAAIATLEAPDPDSRTPEFEGRRIEPVERGWMILTYRAHRRRAQEASRRFQKAEHMRRRRRGRAVDTSGPSEDENAPTQTETQTQTSPQKGRGSPLPPRVVEVLAEELEGERDIGFMEGVDAATRQTAPPEPAQGIPAVWRTLEGWEPTHELRDEARLAGVPPEVFDKRIAILRTGPIGGQRGVLDRNAYVRAFFGDWRTWAEQYRAKAQQGGARRSGDVPVAGGARSTGWGLHPPLEVQSFCKRHDLSPARETRDFLATGAADHVTHDQADKLFRKFLIGRAKGKGKRKTEATP